MPKDFLRCVRQGGRVRTIKPRGSKNPLYIHICYDRNNKSYIGEKKYRTKNNTKRKSKRKSAKRKKRKSKKKKRSKKKQSKK